MNTIVDGENNDNIGELSLNSIATMLWNGKYVILGTSVVAMVLAVLIGFSIHNVYRAEALLVPKLQGGQSDLANLASQYGGLAQLAGIDLSAGSVDKTELGLEVIRSRKFLSNFVKSHELLMPLMASDGWDQSSGELLIDEDVYDLERGEWTRDSKPPRRPRPSAQESVEKFAEQLHVSRDKKTGYVTVAITHHSPRIAQEWVELIIADLNFTIQEDDIREAQNAIEYLEVQIQATPLADVQQVLYRLIGEQYKTVMLANASDEYLFKTIDPAVVPEEKYAPNRIFIILALTLLGFFVGSVFVLARPGKYAHD